MVELSDRGRSLTPRKVLAFAIGPVGAAILGLITLPLITWFFSQEDVGRIAIFHVVLSFGVLLFSLGLDQAYVREFHDVTDKPALLKRAALPGLISLILLAGITLLFGKKVSGWLFGVAEWAISAIVIIALIASFVSRFLSLVLRMNERGLAFSMSQLLPKLLVLVIIGFYILAGAERNFTNLLRANVAAVIFVCIIYGWNTRKEWLSGVSSKLDIKKLKSMLRFGLPLIPGGLAFWGLTAMDKVFLRSLASFEELAIYSVAVSFAAAAAILQSVFSTVWAPMVYKWASNGDGLENVHNVTRYILALVVLGFALAGLLSWVVVFFLPTEYAEVRWIVVSCIGYPLLYTLSETTVVGIGISRKSSYSMLASVLALAVNLAGNWFLIPIYGAAGAAASTCLSFWVFFILRTEFSSYVWKPMPRKLLYSYTSLTVIGSLVFTLWGEALGGWMMLFWGMVLGSWIIVFKKEIRLAVWFLFFRNVTS